MAEMIRGIPFEKPKQDSELVEKYTNIWEIIDLHCLLKFKHENVDYVILREFSSYQETNRYDGVLTYIRPVIHHEFRFTISINGHEIDHEFKFHNDRDERNGYKLVEHEYDWKHKEIFQLRINIAKKFKNWDVSKYRK